MQRGIVCVVLLMGTPMVVVFYVEYIGVYSCMYACMMNGIQKLVLGYDDMI